MSSVPIGIVNTIATWGRMKRRIWAGHGGWYRDSRGLRRVHVDGYAQSFLGKLLEERDGCGQGAFRQHWAEVMWGDGLDVQRCIVGMPETEFDALHLRYVFDPEFGLTVNRKAQLLDLKRTAYLDAIARGEWWLWARLQPESRPDAQAFVGVEKISRETLQFPKTETISSQAGRANSALDATPLHRSTLKIVR